MSSPLPYRKEKQEMGKSLINEIRKSRKVPAKIGGLVTYNGRLYRIAWTTSTGGLVLRDEIIVHPTDPGLDYGVHIQRSIEYMRDVLSSADPGRVAKFFGAWNPQKVGELTDKQVIALFEEFGDALERPTKRHSDMPAGYDVGDAFKI
jgi:hypothetical protein